MLKSLAKNKKGLLVVTGILGIMILMILGIFLFTNTSQGNPLFDLPAGYFEINKKEQLLPSEGQALAVVEQDKNLSFQELVAVQNKILFNTDIKTSGDVYASAAYGTATATISGSCSGTSPKLNVDIDKNFTSSTSAISPYAYTIAVYRFESTGTFPNSWHLLATYKRGYWATSSPSHINFEIYPQPPSDLQIHSGSIGQLRTGDVLRVSLGYKIDANSIPTGGQSNEITLPDCSQNVPVTVTPTATQCPPGSTMADCGVPTGTASPALPWLSSATVGLQQSCNGSTPVVKVNIQKFGSLPFSTTSITPHAFNITINRSSQGSTASVGYLIGHSYTADAVENIVLGNDDNRIDYQGHNFGTPLQAGERITITNFSYRKNNTDYSSYSGSIGGTSAIGDSSIVVQNCATTVTPILPSVTPSPTGSTNEGTPTVWLSVRQMDCNQTNNVPRIKVEVGLTGVANNYRTVNISGSLGFNFNEDSGALPTLASYQSIYLQNALLPVSIDALTGFTAQRGWDGVLTPNFKYKIADAYYRLPGDTVFTKRTIDENHIAYYGYLSTTANDPQSRYVRVRSCTVAPPATVTSIPYETPNLTPTSTPTPTPTPFQYFSSIDFDVHQMCSNNIPYLFVDVTTRNPYASSQQQSSNIFGFTFADKLSAIFEQRLGVYNSKLIPQGLFSVPVLPGVDGFTPQGDWVNTAGILTPGHTYLISNFYYKQSPAAPVNYLSYSKEIRIIDCNAPYDPSLAAVIQPSQAPGQSLPIGVAYSAQTTAQTFIGSDLTCPSAVNKTYEFSTGNTSIDSFLQDFSMYANRDTSENAYFANTQPATYSQELEFSLAAKDNKDTTVIVAPKISKNDLAKVKEVTMKVYLSEVTVPGMDDAFTETETLPDLQVALSSNFLAPTVSQTGVTLVQKTKILTGTANISPIGIQFFTRTLRTDAPAVSSLELFGDVKGGNEEEIQTTLQHPYRSVLTYHLTTEEGRKNITITASRMRIDPNIGVVEEVVNTTTYSATFDTHVPKLILHRPAGDKYADQYAKVGIAKVMLETVPDCQ